MDRKAVEGRLRALALAVIRLVETLPRTVAAGVLGRQLLRAATSAGANYRAAGRGRSRAEFVAKLGIVEEELDETLHWLDLLGASGIMPPARLTDLTQEAGELLAIVVASIRTTRRGRS